ncbi:hypothetical protein LguiA_032375 [Lonicera macranthoides]
MLYQVVYELPLHHLNHDYSSKPSERERESLRAAKIQARTLQGQVQTPSKAVLNL